MPTPDIAQRRYLHGDAHESRQGAYFCALCDEFAPREHFEDEAHASRNSSRYLQSLKAWRGLCKRRGSSWRRPSTAENVLAEPGLRARKLASASTSKFYRWIKKQTKRDDPIGDLANDAASDPGFPASSNSLEELTSYLVKRRASPEAIVALREAWNEFSPSKKEFSRAKTKSVAGSRLRRSGLTLSLRFAVFRRDDYRCQICGVSAQDGTRLEVDHKVPVSKGGRHVLGNLWTLCFRAMSQRVLNE